MEPWQPGKQLITDFDIKLGRLAASVKTDHAHLQILNVHMTQPTCLSY